MGDEIAQAQSRQFVAALEHLSHVSHIPGVEVAHVQARQTPAEREHFFHVCHLRSVEVFYSSDGQEFLHSLKPTVGCCGARVSEGRVKHYLCDISCNVIPRGITITGIQAIGRTSAGTSQVVVIKCERQVVLCINHIGLLGHSAN